MLTACTTSSSPSLRMHIPKLSHGVFWSLDSALFAVQLTVGRQRSQCRRLMFKISLLFLGTFIPALILSAVRCRTNFPTSSTLTNCLVFLSMLLRQSRLIGSSPPPLLFRLLLCLYLLHVGLLTPKASVLEVGMEKC
jgi:hypothetical protein